MFYAGLPRRTSPIYLILAVVDTLEQIGEKHSATSGQVALAWLLAQGADVIPILGRHALKYARISNLL